MNSTRSTLLKVEKVDRVALASIRTHTGDNVDRTFDIRATESTVSAMNSTGLARMSTATSCRIQVVADLSLKPATKSTVSATVDFVAGFGNSRLYRQCVPSFKVILLPRCNRNEVFCWLVVIRRYRTLLLTSVDCIQRPSCDMHILQRPVNPHIRTLALPVYSRPQSSTQLPSSFYSLDAVSFIAVSSSGTNDVVQGHTVKARPRLRPLGIHSKI